jgi:uridine kinase
VQELACPVEAPANDALLDSLPRKQLTFLLGIDGLGGSGKSVVAEKLKRNRTDVTLVHMDDFFLPSAQRSLEPPRQKPIGADFDWQTGTISRCG